MISSIKGQLRNLKLYILGILYRNYFGPMAGNCNTNINKPRGDEVLLNKCRLLELVASGIKLNYNFVGGIQERVSN